MIVSLKTRIGIVVTEDGGEISLKVFWIKSKDPLKREWVYQDISNIRQVDIPNRFKNVPHYCRKRFWATVQLESRRDERMGDFWSDCVVSNIRSVKK